LPSKGKLFFKIPSLLKFLKQPTHNPTDKNGTNKMTEKAQKYNDLTMTVDRRQKASLQQHL
jgi:hypothetical protein